MKVAFFDMFVSKFVSMRGRRVEGTVLVAMRMHAHMQACKQE